MTWMPPTFNLLSEMDARFGHSLASMRISTGRGLPSRRLERTSRSAQSSAAEESLWCGSENPMIKFVHASTSVSSRSAWSSRVSRMSHLQALQRVEAIGEIEQLDGELARLARAQVAHNIGPRILEEFDCRPVGAHGSQVGHPHHQQRRRAAYDALGAAPILD